MTDKDFKPPSLTRPTWEVYLQRTLAIVFLPITATILVSVIIALVATLGQRTGLIYMRTESLFLGFIPFTVAVTIALIVQWTVSKKAALRVFYIALIGLLALVGTAAVFETINTKPIASAASEFRELPGLTREFGNNGDKFSPAPSGFIPCIDIMGEGCPNIARTWVAAPDRDLTVGDLRKVLDDSGWTDVKIREDTCDLRDRQNGSYPDCIAEGMVGDYKATVRIVKIQTWELRMYLRLPTNVR
jgi:hypothetical protein